MSNTKKLQVMIRPMVFSDLKDVLAIDEAIREAETSAIHREITYRGFNTKSIFGMDVGDADSAKRPDILEVAKLIGLGLVAEAEGTICGFVLGRQTYLMEREIHEGEIVILGVHPDYHRNGIATKLMNAICDLFRSRGVHRVRMEINLSDLLAQSFLERAGFSSSHFLHYTKSI